MSKSYYDTLINQAVSGLREHFRNWGPGMPAPRVWLIHCTETAPGLAYVGTEAPTVPATELCPRNGAAWSSIPYAAHWAHLHAAGVNVPVYHKTFFEG